MLSEAGLAIFVDAALAEANYEVQRRPLEPGKPAFDWAHISNPSALLALTDVVYGRRPPAWWITVPAQSFEFGADMSALAKRGVTEALKQIASLLE